MGGEGGTGGPVRPALTRPAWVRPPAVSTDHPLDGIGDVALALGGSLTSWTADLLRLLAKSDMERLAVLAAAVPWHAHAYLWWRRPRPTTPTAGELLAELARAEADVRRCNIHPEAPATHTATMPSGHKQPDGTYTERVPLCGPCADRIAAIGFSVVQHAATLPPALSFAPIAAFSDAGPITLNAPDGGRLCELRPGPDGRWTAVYDPADLDAAARTFLDAVAEIARSRAPKGGADVPQS
ncbi:hypothetical protein MXD62_16665 [Frankia sp. Mgl5]|nr:hypothetical protein [Frankia sp. Mgl5]